MRRLREGGGGGGWDAGHASRHTGDAARGDADGVHRVRRIAQVHVRVLLLLGCVLRTRSRRTRLLKVGRGGDGRRRGFILSVRVGGGVDGACSRSVAVDD